tara:strand:- start:50 stop:1096 length:1047 start_codon:yes stop_codon:yes gene_type:complete
MSILNYTQLGIPAYNFTKSLVLGPSQPYISDTMQNQLIQRAKETELDKGSLGYEAFGLPVATEGGRFTGGLFDLALKDPIGFANAGSVGRVSFEKDPNAPGGYRFGDTTYDFTPDRDTGSTGNPILDFINQGGVKGAVENFFFAPAYAPEPTERERQSIEMGVMNPELTRKFDKSPAPLGMMDRLKGGLGSIRGKVGDFVKGGGILSSIIDTFGSRGNLSTRGIAGLNANDVFNIDMFGTEEDPTKDRYGYNIVSARGNYDKFVKDKARQLAEMQFRTKSGKERQRFFQDAADAIREKERQRDLEEKRRLTARLSTVGGGGGSGSDPTAPGGPQSMGSAKGGAGGRPY